MLASPLLLPSTPPTPFVCRPGRHHLLAHHLPHRLHQERDADRLHHQGPAQVHRRGHHRQGGWVSLSLSAWLMRCRLEVGNQRGMGWQRKYTTAAQAGGFLSWAGSHGWFHTRCSSHLLWAGGASSKSPGPLPPRPAPACDATPAHQPTHTCTQPMFPPAAAVGRGRYQALLPRLHPLPHPRRPRQRRHAADRGEGAGAAEQAVSGREQGASALATRRVAGRSLEGRGPSSCRAAVPALLFREVLALLNKREQEQQQRPYFQGWTQLQRMWLLPGFLISQRQTN